MKSRWKAFEELETGHEYLVFASSIPPKSMRSTWKLFRGASAVRRQLDDTDGIVGFSLLAEPVRKRYATLSLWSDESSLAAFAAHEPHAGLMRELAPAMGPTRFARWTITGDDGLPTWDDALDRLA